MKILPLFAWLAGLFTRKSGTSNLVPLTASEIANAATPAPSTPATGRGRRHDPLYNKRACQWAKVTRQRMGLA